MPKGLSCFCPICGNTFLLPSLFQDYQTCGCMLRWIKELTLLKDTNLALLFHLVVISVPSHHLLHSHVNIHADKGQKVGRWDRRTCGISHSLQENMTRAASLTHRCSPCEAVIELCSKPSHQIGEARNTGFCASNLLYLLVVPQFIQLFY